MEKCYALIFLSLNYVFCGGKGKVEKKVINRFIHRIQDVLVENFPVIHTIVTTYVTVFYILKTAYF